jgi:hypothetical protein
LSIAKGLTMLTKTESVVLQSVKLKFFRMIGVVRSENFVITQRVRDIFLNTISTKYFDKLEMLSQEELKKYLEQLEFDIRMAGEKYGI